MTATGAGTTMTTPRSKFNDPHHASDVAVSKRDLTSWWKQFKRGNAKREGEKEVSEQPRGIFGVPLQTSIRYANVAISLFDADGKSYIYGYVPIVVAKCGVFLKEKALDVEGIFRLSGSEKRIKELKASFDSPNRYGKGLDWTGYTVHDAANILRRYFNQLPEPIIPLEFYEDFRDPLRNHQAQAVGAMDHQAPSEGDFDLDHAIRTYQVLITRLPPLNRQLLLYILDLLAVFASKSDLNKMNTPNLSAIFQPGILSHPSHDMSPPDYRLSQDVLIFLIENQDHFLIGMQGTEADEKTVQEVQSGPPTPQMHSQPRTPPTTTTATSAGAESVRIFGGVRRNVSVSSRHSKSSIGSPNAAGIAAGAGVSGSTAPGIGGSASPRLIQHAPSSPSSSSVHRSNTLPAKRSPGVPSAKFPREKVSSSTTPNPIVMEESGPAGGTDESLGRPNEAAELSESTAGGEPVQASQRDSTSAARHSHRLETIPQNSSTEEIDGFAAPGSGFNTRIAAAIAPRSATNTTDVVSSDAISSTAQESQARAVPTSINTESIPPSSMTTATSTTQPTTPSSALPQSASSNNVTSGKSLSAMFARSPPSDSEQKKDGRRPNKLQKKRNAGNSTNPSARSSTQSLSGQGQSNTTTLVAMGPERVSTEADPRQQQRAGPGSGEGSMGSGGCAGLRGDASPSPSFHSRSSVTDVTDADMATGDEDAGGGGGGGGGGGTTSKTPASAVGMGAGGTKSSSSVSSPPREKQKKKRWRFSSHVSGSNKHGNHGDGKNNNQNINSGYVSGTSNAGDSRSASYGSGSIGDGSGAGAVAGLGIDQQASTNTTAVRQPRKGSASPSQQQQDYTPAVTEEQQQQYQQLYQQQQQQQQQSKIASPATDLPNPSSEKERGSDRDGHQHHYRDRKSSSALEWFKGKLSDRRAEKHLNRTKSPPPRAPASQGLGSEPGAGTGGAKSTGNTTIITAGPGMNASSLAMSPASATTTTTMVTALSSPTSTAEVPATDVPTNLATNSATPATATPTTATLGKDVSQDARLSESKEKERPLSQQDLNPGLTVPGGGGSGGASERRARSMDVPR